MWRPLYLLTDGVPRSEAEVFINFLRSERGRRLVRKHGYLAYADTF